MTKTLFQLQKELPIHIRDSTQRQLRVFLSAEEPSTSSVEEPSAPVKNNTTTNTKMKTTTMADMPVRDKRTEDTKEVPTTPVEGTPQDEKSLASKHTIAECATFNGTRIRFIEGIAKNGNSYEQIQKITKNRNTGKDEFASIALFENELENMNWLALAKFYKNRYSHAVTKAREAWMDIDLTPESDNNE